MKHLMMPITIVFSSLGVDTVFFNLAIDLRFLRFFGFFFGSVDNLFGLVVVVGRILVELLAFVLILEGLTILPLLLCVEMTCLV